MNDNPIRPFSHASFTAYMEENKLMASHCNQCQATFLPPRAICPKCYNDKMSWRELGGGGKIAAFTTVFIGPAFMNTLGFSKDNPYMSGIVELDEGVMVSARLLGFENLKPEQVQIGAPVQVSFLRLGDAQNETIQLAFQKK